MENEILQLLKNMNNQMEQMNSKINQMDNKVSQMDNRIDQIDNKIEKMDNRINQINNKIEKMDNRINQIDNKIEKMDNRVNQIDNKIEKMDEKIDKNTIMLEHLNKKAEIIAEVQTAHKEQNEKTFKNIQAEQVSINSLITSSLKSVSNDINEVKYNVTELKDKFDKVEKVTMQNTYDVAYLKSVK